MSAGDEAPRPPLDYAPPPPPRTVSGELGALVGAILKLFDVLRPFVFALGLGLTLFGFGVVIQGRFSGGPETMGWGGALMGLSLPWWRRGR